MYVAALWAYIFVDMMIANLLDHITCSSHLPPFTFQQCRYCKK